MTILSKLKKYQASILLFAFISIAYIMITGGNFWEYDSFSSYKLAKNIVDKVNFEVNCFWGIPGLEEKCFSRYGLFMSIVIIPFYLVEKIYLEFFRGSFFFPGFFPSLTNIMISSCLSVLIYKYLLRFKFSSKLSVFGAILFAFFTYAVAYTKTLFAEPLITLLIYLCFYVLLFHKTSYRKYLLSGLIFGLGFLTKVTMVIVAPVILYLFWLNKKEWKKIVAFIFPVLISFCVWFIYNYFRFGNIFKTGYIGIGFGENILKGLYLFILSPGKSIFLYQPFIIFFIFGLKEFYFKNKKTFTVFAPMTVIHFIFYSMYAFQSGEWAWGSRFLYTVLPFFVFSVMFFLQEEKRRLMKILFYVSVVISFLIQFSAVYISYHRYYSFMSHKYGANFTRLVYPRFDHSPLFGQWKLIFRLDYNQKDNLSWREAFQEYPSFYSNYKIAPPDLFFFRSKKLIIPVLALLAVEFALLLKLFNKDGYK